MTTVSFILTLLAGVLVFHMTVKDAPLRESPQSNAPVALVVDTGTQVDVVQSRPYYYYIRFLDQQTGEYVEGWISKRSVQKYPPKGEDEDTSVATPTSLR